MPSSVADRVVQARPDLVWAVVADVALYAQLATGLSHVEILEGDGQGLRRRCYDTRGRGWNETCTVWEPGRRFQMRVDTASYPFPLRLLLRSFQGTWSVDPAPEGARITVGFDAEPRLGPLGRLALRAMGEGPPRPHPASGQLRARHPGPQQRLLNPRGAAHDPDTASPPDRLRRALGWLIGQESAVTP
jgi:ribosome-associated toxin RatA of RatAB toxin-antitoxin module